MALHYWAMTFHFQASSKSSIHYDHHGCHSGQAQRDPESRDF